MVLLAPDYITELIHHYPPAVLYTKVALLLSWKWVIFKLLLVTYKALDSLAPDYITEPLRHYSPARTLHSSSFITLLNNG